MVRTSFRLCLKKRKLKKGSGKDSVRTSVLSERWRNLWLHVPALDLDTRNFRDDIEFLDFVDRFLESYKEFDIKRFKLYFESYDAGEDCHDKFVRMISEMLKRRVCHLTVLNCPEFDDAVVLMPLSLYSCASLVDLTLYGVVMDNPESELVSLPCVKSIHLEAIEFDGISILETLISNCPVLENLVVITHFDYSEVLFVRSQSLKSFKLHSRYNEGADPVFEIDAPRLEYMSITDYPWQKFRIHNIGPSTEVNIDVESDFEDLEPLYNYDPLFFHRNI